MNLSLGKRGISTFEEMQEYGLFGLCPSSGIPKNTSVHNILETGSISGVGGRYPCADTSPYISSCLFVV
jgi:hypothetical protein